MKTIGIVGGGQLGQMMIDAANELGISAIVLDPDSVCPCSKNALEVVVGNYDDFSKLEAIVKKVDVLTYEFENVDAEAISKLEGKYNIPQGSFILSISQNRIKEKDFAVKAGFNTAQYKKVSSNEELYAALNNIGYPCILKTVTGGYDGKGQFLFNSEKDLIDIDREYILEEKIDFDYEVSCIASRSVNNEIVVFPLFKNDHVKGILNRTKFLRNDKFQKEVEKIMIDYMNMMDYRGTLCVELFIKGDEIIFNEMAPRPHNSGHMTIEGCSASQYKNHILGILGLPLEKVEIIHDVQMVNILGEDILKEEEMKKEKNVIIHNYGKKEVRPRRKMGHATFVDASEEEINRFIDKYKKEY